MITGLRAYAIRVPLIEEFRIALGASVYYEGVIVEVSTDEGIVGYGEGVPSRRITGETTDSILSLISRFRRMLVGKDPLNYVELLERIDRAVLGNPAAKAAIDIAIFDIVAKKYGVPLRTFLGGGPNSFETSVTIGIMDKETAVRKATRLVEDGVTILKIKIGLNPTEDIERVVAIRKAVGDDIRIRIDANQGYTVKQAIRVLRALENVDIEYCEQPVHWRDLSGMREVRRKTEIPIMADESVHGPRDALEVIKLDAADMINIKLMKSGGILGAIKIAHICEAAGVECQIGCMSETRIAISAGLHLAVSLDIIKYSDLDGYLFLSDSVANGLSFEKSKNKISDGCGLGINVDKKKLEKYLITKI